MCKTKFFIPDALVDPETYKTRSEMTKACEGLWTESKRGLESRSFKNVIGYMPKEIYIASDTRWKDYSFGAVNTLQDAGCIVFAAKYLLDFYGIQYSSVVELADEIASKNYRCWRFENFPKVFSSYEATIEDAKQVLPDDCNANCLEEAIDITGKIVGIGGRHVLFDNIIAEVNAIKQIEDTRIVKIEEAINILERGGFVPMRVENSTYHGNPTKTGGHFITLTAIENNMARVLDSSEIYGMRTLPAKQLFQAATVAWKVM